MNLLTIPEDDFDLILSGHKTNIVKPGKTGVGEGTCYIRTSARPSDMIEVYVKLVENVPFGELTILHATEAGFPGLEIMHARLLERWPHLTFDDEMSIITFKVLRSDAGGGSAGGNTIKCRVKTPKPF